MGGGAQVRLWIGNAQRHLRVPFCFGNGCCGAWAIAVVGQVSKDHVTPFFCRSEACPR
ncbi:hypothetical protein C4K38_4129 [Pseudomonas chlororaphis subsp. piscium]|nr:hypothetical protein C4K38_4129 [Pseudomonas chlororaphis subsp. piscium]